MTELLVVDYPSYYESLLLKGVMKSTSVIPRSDVIVNPISDSLRDKVAIVNLPGELSDGEVRKYPKLISRFPVSDSVVIPYRIPEVRNEVSLSDMSFTLLSKELLLDERYLEVVHQGKFLLGVGECVNDHATLVGQLILRNRVEDLVESE